MRSGVFAIQIPISEFRINVGKCIDLADSQDVYIMKDGKQVAKIIASRR